MFSSRRNKCSLQGEIKCPRIKLIKMTRIFLLDQDECAVYGTCSQTCVNTHGSYVCGCVEGYVMQPNNRTCKAKIGKLRGVLSFQNFVSFLKFLFIRKKSFFFFFILIHFHNSKSRTQLSVDHYKTSCSRKFLISNTFSKEMN